MDSCPTCPYHSDPLQVHFCPPELLPVVMLVTFPLGDPAEISRQLKDVLHQRTPTDLVHGDLDRTQETQRRVSRSFSLRTVAMIYFTAVAQNKGRRVALFLTFGSLECSGHKT